jgi:hypothetical protein
MQIKKGKTSRGCPSGFLYAILAPIAIVHAGQTSAEQNSNSYGAARVIPVPAPYESFGKFSTVTPDLLTPPNDWELHTPAYLRKSGSAKSVTFTVSDTLVNLYGKTIFTITHNGTYSNPYNPNDIRVDAQITKPDGSVILLPCFFRSGSSGNSIWEGRFMPQLPGQYSVKMNVTSGGATQTSDTKTFRSQASSLDGVLHLDKKSAANFIFDSGKHFRGVGENFGWEGNGYTYQSMSAELKSYECSFYRTWMCPFNMPLEWTSSGVGYYNETSAKKMDTVLATAAANGLYVMLVLGFHGELWINADTWGGNNYWPQNPYNSANGGPCATPNDFFANAQSQEFYKRRLRYIVARWGYHPNLAAVEFFNEVDHDVIGSGCTVAAVSAWHDTMTAFLKKTDPFGHLLTTSVSYNEYPTLINVPNLDFMQEHYYGSQSGEGGVTQNFNSECLRYIKTYKKPFVIGEFSRYWEGDSYPTDADYTRILHLGMWRGALSMTPVVPMTWWWEKEDVRGNYSQFRNVSRFVQAMTTDPAAVLSQKQIRTSPSLEVLSIKAGNKYYFWTCNTSASSVNNVSLMIDSVSNNGSFSVRWYGTNMGTFTNAANVTSSATTLTLSVASIAAGRDTACEVTDVMASQVAKVPVKALDPEFKVSLKSNILHVSSPIPFDGPVSVTLSDLQGRTVLKSISVSNGRSDFSLPLTNEKHGAFIVRVKTSGRTQAAAVVH